MLHRDLQEWLMDRRLALMKRIDKAIKMKIAETKENKAIIEALKKSNQCKWVGNTTHDTMDKCLTAINLQTSNSGHYNPVASRLNGCVGFYLINQDGSICYDMRVVKKGEKEFVIEYLTSSGFEDFERNYYKFIGEQ